MRTRVPRATAAYRQKCRWELELIPFSTGSALSSLVSCGTSASCHDALRVFVYEGEGVIWILNFSNRNCMFFFSQIWFIPSARVVYVCVYSFYGIAALSNFFCAEVKQSRIIVEYIFSLFFVVVLVLYSQAGSLKNILDWFYVCFLLYKTNLLLQKRSNIY